MRRLVLPATGMAVLGMLLGGCASLMEPPPPKVIVRTVIKTVEKRVSVEKRVCGQDCCSRPSPEACPSPPRVAHITADLFRYCRQLALKGECAKSELCTWVPGFTQTPRDRHPDAQRFCVPKELVTFPVRVIVD